MMQVMPNRGLMLDDQLDGLRAKAIGVSFDGVPLEVVEYLNALEARYHGLIHEQQRRGLKDVAWRVKE